MAATTTEVLVRKAAQILPLVVMALHTGAAGAQVAPRATQADWLTAVFLLVPGASISLEGMAGMMALVFFSGAGALVSNWIAWLIDLPSATLPYLDPGGFTFHATSEGLLLHIASTILLAFVSALVLAAWHERRSPVFPEPPRSPWTEFWTGHYDPEQHLVSAYLDTVRYAGELAEVDTTGSSRDFVLRDVIVLDDADAPDSGTILDSSPTLLIPRLYVPGADLSDIQLEYFEGTGPQK